ncbi:MULTISPECIES: hypothetical protein [Cohnella]|uniref:hypothetical protein n=1 Tax=Cohnella TaxID=329857 RepID=UPI0009BC522D|nr:MULTISPECIES: hypothetical protein [Cohnella]MBN2982548.1 hypothetical protein [Cohnella algarum]
MVYLSLQLSQSFLQQALRAGQFEHLKVRVHDTHLVVYSLEGDEEALRALFLQLRANRFWLNIASPKGKIQPTPFIGSVRELFPILTDKLAFSLVRW